MAAYLDHPTIISPAAVACVQCMIFLASARSLTEYEKMPSHHPRLGLAKATACLSVIVSRTVLHPPSGMGIKEEMQDVAPAR